MHQMSMTNMRALATKLNRDPQTNTSMGVITCTQTAGEEDK